MTVVTINSDSLSVSLSSYGARIFRIAYADHEVSLHYENEKQYLSDNAYLGATIAPITNRISEGKLSIDNKHYQLPKNEGSNTLHSGGVGADKTDWKIESSDTNYVAFSTDIELQELGMQGVLSLRAIYQVLENELLIEYQAQCSENTYVNTTNHVYLNLSGNSLAGANQSINDHVFNLYGINFVEIDSQSIPTGNVTPLVEDPLEFKIEQESVHDEFDGMIDHHFNVTTGFSNELHMMASARSEITGITLKVLSNAPGYQFYTGKFLQDPFVESGGFCIETQLAPDAINQPDFYSPVLKAKEVRSHKTIFKFAIHR